MITLTLIYADGTQFIVGGFPNQAQADAWLANEKNQPYWDSRTQANFEVIPEFTRGI